MEWFSQNWVWVLIVVGMITIHMFGHGGHGGSNDEAKLARESPVERTPEQGPGHRH